MDGKASSIKYSAPPAVAVCGASPAARSISSYSSTPPPRKASITESGQRLPSRSPSRRVSLTEGSVINATGKPEHDDPSGNRPSTPTPLPKDSGTSSPSSEFTQRVNSRGTLIPHGRNKSSFTEGMGGGGFDASELHGLAETSLASGPGGLPPRKASLTEANLSSVADGSGRQDSFTSTTTAGARRGSTMSMAALSEEPDADDDGPGSPTGGNGAATASASVLQRAGDLPAE